MTEKDVNILQLTIKIANDLAKNDFETGDNGKIIDVIYNSIRNFTPNTLLNENSQNIINYMTNEIVNVIHNLDDTLDASKLKIHWNNWLNEQFDKIL